MKLDDLFLALVRELYDAGYMTYFINSEQLTCLAGIVVDDRYHAAQLRMELNPGLAELVIYHGPDRTRMRLQDPQLLPKLRALLVLFMASVTKSLAAIR